jgi:hypothetical protein
LTAFNTYATFCIDDAARERTETMAGEWENVIAAREAKMAADAQLRPYLDVVTAANAALLVWVLANRSQGCWPRDKNGARIEMPAPLWKARADAIDALAAKRKAISYDKISDRLEEAWLIYNSPGVSIRVVDPHGQEIQS